MVYLLLNFELFLTFLTFLSLCESLLAWSPVVKDAVCSWLSVNPSFARFLIRWACCNLWHRVCCSVCCHECCIGCCVFGLLDCAFFFALCFLFRCFFWRAFCRFEKLVKHSLSFALCLSRHVDACMCVLLVTAVHHTIAKHFNFLVDSVPLAYGASAFLHVKKVLVEWDTYYMNLPICHEVFRSRHIRSCGWCSRPFRSSRRNHCTSAQEYWWRGHAWSQRGHQDQHHTKHTGRICVGRISACALPLEVCIRERESS